MIIKISVTCVSRYTKLQRREIAESNCRTSTSYKHFARGLSL